MTKGDKLIFCMVLFSALLVFFASNLAFHAKGPGVIVIEQNGKPYATYQMGTLTEPKILTITHKEGYHKLEVSCHGVKVLETNCSEQVCKTQITSVGQSIVCLPYRLMIRIEGVGEVDAVAY